MTRGKAYRRDKVARAKRRIIARVAQKPGWIVTPAQIGRFVSTRLRPCSCWWCQPQGRAPSQVRARDSARAQMAEVGR